MKSEKNTFVLSGLSKDPSLCMWSNKELDMRLHKKKINVCLMCATRFVIFTGHERQVQVQYKPVIL